MLSILESVLYAQRIVVANGFDQSQSKTCRTFAFGGAIETVENTLSVEWLGAVISDLQFVIADRNVDLTAFGRVNIGIADQVANQSGGKYVIHLDNKRIGTVNITLDIALLENLVIDLSFVANQCGDIDLAHLGELTVVDFGQIGRAHV